MTDGQAADPERPVNPGTAGARPVTITVTDYNGSRLDERIVTRPGEIRAPTLLPPAVTWVNVDGVHDAGIVQAIGEAFGIHPLTLEDIANTHQRPKIEDYGDYLYVAVRMLPPYGAGEFRSEQVSLVLGKNYVISFQEEPDDAFERIRERCVPGPGGSGRRGGLPLLRPAGRDRRRIFCRDRGIRGAYRGCRRGGGG
jgi:magnesium transporter